MRNSTPGTEDAPDESTDVPDESTTGDDDARPLNPFAPGEPFVPGDSPRDMPQSQPNT